MGRHSQAMSGRRPLRRVAGLAAGLAAGAAGVVAAGVAGGGAAAQSLWTLDEVIRLTAATMVERCGLAVTDPAAFEARVGDWPDLGAARPDEGGTVLWMGQQRPPGDGGDDLQGVLTEVYVFPSEGGTFVSCHVAGYGEPPGDGRMSSTEAELRAAVGELMPDATWTGAQITTFRGQDVTDMMTYQFAIRDWHGAGAPGLVAHVGPGGIGFLVHADLPPP